MDMLSPGDVAALLGVEDRTLRRYAEAYETVYGALPQDGRRHRRYPPDAVDRLSAAVVILRERPALGMVAALRGEGGAPAVADTAPRAGDVGIAREVRELRDTVAGLVAAMQMQSAEVREVNRRLEVLIGQRGADLVVQAAPEFARKAARAFGTTGRGESRATAPGGASRPSRDRKGGQTGRRGQTERLALTVPELRVVSTTMPRGLKWLPEKYAAAEALLAEGDRLTARGVNYVTAQGNVMSWRTAEALYAQGVLV